MTDHGIPKYTLLVRWPDDTMDVVCHWHHKPTADEVNDMILTYIQMTPRVPVDALLTKTKRCQPVAYTGDDE